MFVLILGPNNSGKSAYAEKLIADLDGRKRYYIATMIPYGEEGKARVMKHLEMRENLHMVTLEDPYLENTSVLSGDSDVLLEDLSNLVANRMFEKGLESCDTIADELEALNRKVRNLVVVSIGGISSEGYDEETECYIRKLNEINCKVEGLADRVVRM